MAEKTTPVAATAVDADKLTRDLEGAQFRVLELEHKLAEVEKQRDEAQRELADRGSYVRGVSRDPNVPFLASALLSAAQQAESQGHRSYAARAREAARKVLAPVLDELAPVEG